MYLIKKMEEFIMAKEKVTTVDPVEEANNLVSKALVALEKFKEISSVKKNR